jgi:hypothetical protein
MLPVLIAAGSAAALGVYAGVLDRGRLATAGVVLASMLLLSVVYRRSAASWLWVSQRWSRSWCLPVARYGLACLRSSA